jgi:hypothetical protein
MAGSSLIGNLAILLSMDTSAFERGATHAQRLLARTQRQFHELGERITHIGIGMSAAITAPFAELLHEAIPVAIETRDALGQVEAALHSMGPVAGRTKEQLEEAAHALERISLFHTDDILRNVTANMLTFGQVTGDNFDRAQLAAVNMATRLREDLQPATIMIGRALNDPIRGLTALRRVGVAFSADQETMIRGFVATGNAAGAQNVILRELEREFGGAAAAARAARPDAEMRQSWHEFQEVVGAIALRVLPPLTRGLTTLLDKFNQLSPRTQEIAVGAAAIAAAFGPILLVVGPLVGMFGRLLPLIAELAPVVTGLATAWGVAGAAGGGLGVALAGLLPEIAILAGAAALIYLNWQRISPLLQQVGEALNTALGPAVRDAITAVSNALSALWNGPFGQAVAQVGQGLVQLAGILIDVFGPGAVAMLRGYIAFFAGFVELIANALNLVVALLRGDWSGAWEATKALVIGVWHTLGRVIDGVVPGALASLRRLYEGAKTWLVDKFNDLVVLFMAPIHAIEGAFAWLYDRVVGHSWIPDMVDEIGQHMRRLDAEMVRPAADAAAAAGEHFRALSGLLDRLFPENRRRIQLEADLTSIGGAGLSPAAQAEARRRLFLQNGALDNVVPINAGQIGAATEAFGELGDQGVDAFSRLNRAGNELGRTINDTIENGLKQMMRGFGSLKDIALNVLYAIGDALIENLFSRIGSGSKGGGIGGAIASIIGSVVPQRRAMGGPVTSGQGYVVGENGPEWFTPSRSGAIIPNHELVGGRGDITIHQHIQFDGVAITQQEFVQGLQAVKFDTIGAIQQARRRAG